MKNQTKEKAEELLNKYRTHIRKADVYNRLVQEDEIYLAKQCTLVYLNDIISECDSFDFYDCHLRKNFWKGVKQEIEKLSTSNLILFYENHINKSLESKALKVYQKPLKLDILISL